MTPQNLIALRRANEVRLHRARTLRAVRDGELCFADIDLDDPRFARMTLYELLRRLPWYNAQGNSPHRTFTATKGPSRVVNLLGAHATTRVGALSARRKAELRAIVAEVNPTQRGQEAA